MDKNTLYFWIKHLEESKISNAVFGSSSNCKRK